MDSAFSVGEDRARGREATFRVKKDSHTVSAGANGYVEGVATIDVSRGEAPTYDFHLSHAPHTALAHRQAPG